MQIARTLAVLCALAGFLAAGCASQPRPEPDAPPPAPAAAGIPSNPSAPSPTADSAAVDDLLAEYAMEDSPSTDTLRVWNKAMFHFNDKVFFWFIKPVSKGYRAILPRRARLGVRNAIDNLGFPRRFINCELQGRSREAGIELTRFLTNTTVGLAGTWDPAKEWMDLSPQPRDFDQTLGKWGAGTGCFITWPFLGPSSVRGTFGAAGDWATDPLTLLNWAGAEIAFWVSPSVKAGDQINDASLGKTAYEQVLEIAVDPYTAVRDAHLQNRAKKISE